MENLFQKHKVLKSGKKGQLKTFSFTENHKHLPTAGVNDPYQIIFVFDF